MGHIYAALMADYAKDALETETPWVWWECSYLHPERWTTCNSHPQWEPSMVYRRKRNPLCQIEGKDVFPGDKLWHIHEKRWITAAEHTSHGATSIVIADDGASWIADWLSWSEPTKTKTVYQWAFLRGTWQVSWQFYETEGAARTGITGATKFRRLDYTAMVVPA